jgi:ethanolamine utilization protein EutA
MRVVADCIAARIMEIAELAPISSATSALMRLPRSATGENPVRLIFSGGVAEYIYGNNAQEYGDLGPAIAAALRNKLDSCAKIIEKPTAMIRATVIGASQYTMQVSGATIFIAPADAVPLNNVSVILTGLDLSVESIDSRMVATMIRQARAGQGLETTDRPFALAFSWQGSATFRRLEDFCVGLASAMADMISAGHPLILLNQCDVGRLIGAHLREEMAISVPVVSIDGIHLGALDFVDIGQPVSGTGAVPVVVKSLVFPASDSENGMSVVRDSY